MQARKARTIAAVPVAVTERAAAHLRSRGSEHPVIRRRTARGRGRSASIRGLSPPRVYTHPRTVVWIAERESGAAIARLPTLEAGGDLHAAG